MDSLEEVAEAIYGTASLPRIHLVVSSGSGRYGADLNRVKGTFSPLLKTFKGEAVLIRDIEDWMTDDEKDLFDSL
jgi:hypothetical protein